MTIKVTRLTISTFYYSDARLPCYPVSLRASPISIEPIAIKLSCSSASSDPDQVNENNMTNGNENLSNWINNQHFLLFTCTIAVLLFTKSRQFTRFTDQHRADRDKVILLLRIHRSRPGE
ncbi:hypothetical protein CDAR_275311 [Caerostris darwini]|uniref:Uncharacterized protein n=1 Tax=Caerostris darwini TaxID=1538125 RepID=A0AAV4MQD1_9ARAC|nr:hypothetical protein CDAR_275311 [Caerostris darwini]